MFGRLIENHRTIRRHRGRRRAGLVHLSLLPVWAAVVTAAQGVDLLSARVRRSRVRSPIVIIGNPRSGTTFLHRYLDERGIATGSRILDIVLPTLVLNRAASWVLSRRRSSESFSSNVAHETGLAMVDNDDIGLMLRYLDGPLQALGLGALAEPPPRARDTVRRDLAWMARMWRRVLVIRGGERIVAKFHAMDYRVADMLAAVPDARVVYMVRDPLEAIPSAISLSEMHLRSRFGLDRLTDAERRRYHARVYAVLLDGYRRFTADWRSGGIDRSRVMLIRYDRLMTDFAAVMAELLAFVGHDPTPALAAGIAATAAGQKGYVSRHRYDLAAFGLDEARIRADCAPVYETFFPPPSLPRATAAEIAETERGEGGAAPSYAEGPIGSGADTRI